MAIVGAPNAGKSSLLNLLLHDDRAIVSDIPGTTRDTIEDTTVVDGLSFRFIDTAGLRQTSDAIENLGIERTWTAVSRARIVLWVVDSSLEKRNVGEGRGRRQRVAVLPMQKNSPMNFPKGFLPIAS